MLLYLIRHGQTADNAQRKVGSYDITLSQKGIDDADKLAQRLSAEKIDAIISSDQKRAVQTAEIIASALKLAVQKEQLVRERKGPTSLIGESIDSPKVKAWSKHLDEQAHDPSLHFEDAENASEVVKRVQTFLQKVGQRTEQRICVVTHAGFLRYFGATVLLGAKVRPEVVRHIYSNFVHNNTAITVCELTKEKGWRLITWNDQAHLGDTHHG